MKRGSKFVSALVVAMMLAFSLMIAGCGQQESGDAAADSGEGVSYTLIVDATEADEGILYDQEATVAAGTTVYQALAETGLSLEVDSMSGMTYVYGIGDVVADDGSAAWMFTVNGEAAPVGADQTEIADGDVVEWKYYKDATMAM